MSSQQRSLFESDPVPWEDDDESQRLIATIVPAKGFQGEFDYLVPDELADQLQVGCRVDVPLGRANRLVTGYCAELGSRAVGSRRLKSVRRVLDRQSLLSPSMLRLTRWIAEHYLCSWGLVLDAVLPAGVRDRAGIRRVTLLTAASEIAAKIPQLDLPDKQRQALATLVASRRPLSAAQLAKMSGCTTGPIAALRKKGFIEAKPCDVQQFGKAEVPVERQTPLELNRDQQKALDAITTSLHSRQHQTVLLHGVTGSGKTEVYIQAIQHVVSFGRQAIVLVPEISLTPQTRERFRSRFDSVAVLHSHLSDVERHGHWQRITAGQVQVVVGARSAVFAPTPNLGLIVLDEEHESSFKQSMVPRYHARDVAQWRASDEDVPLVLGSATPSLESWQRTAEGTYRLVEMPRRVLGRPMPDVVTIDLRSESRDRAYGGAISRPLHRAMDQALSDGGQIILLLNRRGFSTHIQCPACGHVVLCPDCDIALTHHRQGEAAICHYCDYQTPTPTECPACRFTGIRYSGLGTQRLEAEVRARFPGQACLRMDSDSMRQSGSHEKALDQFRAGQVRILLGTQMIAKGLDFPNVTLVGVINADTALHLPDFRAGERTFQLVTQVAGRTGRGEQGGRVLVQTFSPDHPSILASVRHDYDAFARYELPIRESLGYPPFSSMVRLVIRGRVEEQTRVFAQHLADMLRQTAGKAASSDESRPRTATADVRILGPAPAPIQKLRGDYRFQIQAQSADDDHLRSMIRRVTADLKTPDEVQWIVDIDPVEML